MLLCSVHPSEIRCVIFKRQNYIFEKKDKGQVISVKTRFQKQLLVNIKTQEVLDELRIHAQKYKRDDKFPTISRMVKTKPTKEHIGLSLETMFFFTFIDAHQLRYWKSTKMHFLWKSKS